MTNDELIRQVATEIKRNHQSGTMEEALDAAKAVVKLMHHTQNNYDNANSIILDVIFSLTSPYPSLDLQQIVTQLAEAKTLRLSSATGADYTLLSTEPQIVTEIIEPEAKSEATHL